LPTVDLEDVVAIYVQAWHEPDEAARRRLLEQSWADDGVYADAAATIEGREALVTAITEFHAERPGVTIEIRSRIDGFGPHFRFVWTTVDANGDELRAGIDIGRLDENGRIASILGFSGIVPDGV
jgi:hypothetical protein